MKLDILSLSVSLTLTLMFAYVSLVLVSSSGVGGVLKLIVGALLVVK